MEATSAPQTPPDPESTVLDLVMSDTSGDSSGGLPLNKIVAFLGPYVAIASGAVADWLLVHVHLLATFHLGHDATANAVAQLLIFGVTTAVVWIGHHKWLDGWQKFEQDMRLPMLAEAKKALSEAGGPPGGAFDPAAAQAELDRKIAAGEVQPPSPPAEGGAA